MIFTYMSTDTHRGTGARTLYTPPEAHIEWWEPLGQHEILLPRWRLAYTSGMTAGASAAITSSSNLPANHIWDVLTIGSINTEHPPNTHTHLSKAGHHNAISCTIASDCSYSLWATHTHTSRRPMFAANNRFNAFEMLLWFSVAPKPQLDFLYGVCRLFCMD